MNITEYFRQLNQTSQKIFDTTMTDSINLGKTHSISSFMVEFSECLFEKEEKEILRTVAIQLETATLNLSLGLYRQAFSSLRLAFEMGLALIYFSINKLEHNEWLNGNNDIKWAKLINEDDGVLSKRFAKAFFPEFEEIINEYNRRAKKVYRKMSEYVHGNSDTWQKSGLSLKYNEELKNKYFELFKEVSELLLFVLNCRYLKSLNEEKIDSISEFLLEDLGHITAIREYLNEVKE
jgi:hypothetical protein